MNKQYSRRFALGQTRYMTNAFIEDGYVIIKQSERMEHPKIDYRSSITLSIQDFKNMVKTLEL